MALKNDDPRIADVHALMRRALDWFRGELQRLGPLKAPPPALFVTMAPGLVVGMPLAPLESGMNFTLLTCHQVLRQLDPVSYVYVCDVRTEGRPPQYGAHCCGGFAGWDAALAEKYRFDGDEVTLVAKSQIKASTEVREYHFTIIPNLIDGVGLPAVSSTEKEHLEFIVQGLVSEIREVANRAKH